MKKIGLCFFLCYSFSLVWATPACVGVIEGTYKPLFELIGATELVSRVESADLAVAERKLQTAKAGVNRWPLSVEIEAKPYRQSSVLQSQSGQTQTASVSVDLVESFRGEGRAGRVLQKEQARLNLAKQQQRLLAQTLRSLVELAALEDLFDLLSYRVDLLARRVEYFLIRQEMGDFVSGELLDTEARLLEARNKLDAIRIRQTSELLKLASGYAPSIDVGSLALPSIRSLPTDIDLVCDESSSFPVREKRMLREIAEHKVAFFRQKQGPQVGFFSNWVNEKVDTFPSQKTTTSGVRLSYTLWAGGAKQAEEVELLNGVHDAEALLALHSQLEFDRIRNWQSSKTVFLSAIRANQIKIAALQQQVIELREKSSSETGVYVVSSDVQLQLSSLIESDIGVRKDFAIGNINNLELYSR